MVSRNVFVLCVSVLVYTGCLGIRTGKPVGHTRKHIEARGRLDSAGPAHWEQVYLGESPRLSLLGYVRTEHRAATQGTRWVYDQQFELIGRVSPNGRTQRVRLNGSEAHEGSYTLDYALLKLFRRESSEKITRSRMPPPRSR